MWPAKTDFEQLLLIKNSLGNLTEKQSLTLITQGLYDQVSDTRLPEHYLLLFLYLLSYKHSNNVNQTG